MHLNHRRRLEPRPRPGVLHLGASPLQKPAGERAEPSQIRISRGPVSADDPRDTDTRVRQTEIVDGLRANGLLLRIATIIGSTWPGTVGKAVGEWVYDITPCRDGASDDHADDDGARGWGRDLG